MAHILIVSLAKKLFRFNFSVSMTKNSNFWSMLQIWTSRQSLLTKNYLQIQQDTCSYNHWQDWYSCRCFGTASKDIHRIRDHIGGRCIQVDNNIHKIRPCFDRCRCYKVPSLKHIRRYLHYTSCQTNLLDIYIHNRTEKNSDDRLFGEIYSQNRKKKIYEYYSVHCAEKHL